MIRKACARDGEQIAAIYKWYVENTTITYEITVPGPTEMTQRILDTIENNPYLVYEEAGKVVGYAYSHQLRPREAFFVAAEVSIYLDKDACHGGKGQELIDALFEELKKYKYTTAVALISADNENSAKFFEKLGFNFKGTIDHVGYKFNKWLGLSYYSKQLKEYTD